jgi:hypothetical protein
MKTAALFLALMVVTGCCEDETQNQENPNELAIKTAIGPIGLDTNKWGPEGDGISWPGRIEQKEPTHPIYAQDHAIYEIVLPENARVISAHIWVDPKEGHAVIPDNRAGAMLWTRNGGLDEDELLGHAVTPANSVASYEYRYLLTIEPHKELISKPDTRIFVHVIGEYGKNFVQGLVVDTPEFVYETKN